MKQLFSWSRGVLIALILVLTSSCTSAESRLKAEFDVLPQTASTLLYEYEGTSAGATGECAGTFLHRWYGSAMAVEDVVKMVEDSLSDYGWTILPDEVGKIWSKENKEGLYQVSLNIFDTPKAISQEQGLYKLPDPFMSQATNYQTVYLISMNYTYPSVAKKCFGK